MRALILIGVLLILCPRSPAQPDGSGFQRGHIYVTEIWAEGCWVGAPQFIREIDPTSGQSWIFADISDGLCDPAGLVFAGSPSRLRLANFSTSEVFDFDAYGNHVVEYTSRDGLSGPGNDNGMAFDGEGSFFITNQDSGRLLKLQNDAKPAILFADGIWGGAIRVHPDGRLFFCASGGLVIYTFDADGLRSTYELLAPAWNYHSMAIASNGDLFVGISYSNSHDPPTSTIYKYVGADLSRKCALATVGQLSEHYTLALSADEREVYVCESNSASIFGIDVEIGEVRTVFEFPDPYIANVGYGMAVYALPLPPLPAGDVNCDGTVNAFDIDPFILALSDDTAYSRKFPGCNIDLADTNADGSLNQFDIQPFVALLTP